jgi:hypothetical protein
VENVMDHASQNAVNVGVGGYKDVRAVLGGSAETYAESDGSRMTIGGAISAANELHGVLREMAEVAEKMAEHFAGSLPPSDPLCGGTASATQAGQAPALVDMLNIRIAACDSPARRIRNALSRIEQRLG